MSQPPPGFDDVLTRSPIPGRRRELYQVHPLTIALEALMWVRRMAAPLAIFVVLSFQGGSGRGDTFEIAIGALAGLKVLFAGINYLISRWGFEGDVFLWKTGVLQKQERNIPMDRIQNVEIVRNLAHRWLGLADLKIDTGVGGMAEVTISALGFEDAKRLQQDLLKRRVGSFELSAEAPSTDQAIWKATTRDLVFAGLSENRAMTLVGTVFGLFTFMQFGEDAMEKWIESTIRSLIKGAAAQDGDVKVITFLWVAVGLLIVGWIMGIAHALIKYHGFSIVQKGDRIVREYGLFTHLSAAIPVRRVQVFSASAGWVKRRLGFWSTECWTAGSVIDLEASGSNVLCPVVESDELSRFIKLIFDDVLYDRLKWNHVSRKTIARHAVRYGLFWAMVSVGLAFGLNPLAGAIFVPGVVISVVAARKAWEVMRYSREAGYTSVWTGLVKQRLYVVPDGKIQSLSLTDSPFQRRAGLMTLKIFTAGQSVGNAVEIVDLPVDEAVLLHDALKEAAGRAGAWQVDGV